MAAVFVGRQRVWVYGWRLKVEEKRRMAIVIRDRGKRIATETITTGSFEKGVTALP